MSNQRERENVKKVNPERPMLTFWWYVCKKGNEREGSEACVRIATFGSRFPLAANKQIALLVVRDCRRLYTSTTPKILQRRYCLMLKYTGDLTLQPKHDSESTVFIVAGIDKLVLQNPSETSLYSTTTSDWLRWWNNQVILN